MTSRRAAPSRGDRGGKPHGHPVFTGSPDHNHAVTIAPPKLRTGQVRCPACRNATRVRKNGKLAMHRDLFGNDCWCRDTGNAVPIVVELPPVNLGRGGGSTNTTPPDGYCQECSKPIPPMRRLCGRCAARRMS